MNYTILSKPNCHYCQKAKELLDSRGVSYQEFDLSKYKNKWLVNLLLKSGTSTVPQVWDDTGAYVGGYEDLEDLL